ncbi:cytochrome P450 [Trametes polyzona]|nr:cytochrome P450 [Trametes polyzona]
MFDTPVVWTTVAVIAALYLYRWYTDPLRSIPTVGGYSFPFLSTLSTAYTSFNSKRIFAEGYKKYYGRVFKVPYFDRWAVVLSGPRMVDELRRRPEDEFSLTESIENLLQIRNILGNDTEDDPYHIDIVKEKFPRNVPAILREVIDELHAAVPQYIPANAHEWLEVPVVPAAQQIIARASNRIFVGLPACRDQEYLDLTISFTKDIVMDGTFVKIFPKALRPYVGKYWSNARSNLRKAISRLKPVIDARRGEMEKYGDDWAGKPNDLLQWIMDVAQSKDCSDQAIVSRIMLVCFASIHTSSDSFTQAIYHLAERPEYLGPLREEIESILSEEGWTKNAMDKMRKLDSFLRESQRHNGVGVAGMGRIVLKDVTLHDGTFIPRGVEVVAATYGIHRNPSVYPDADIFDPFRFARLRETEGEELKHQFINTSLDYIAFGHGKHACPGRFFAANEIKALLAFIILKYDLKLPGDGKRPNNIYWGMNVIPAQNGKVLFRKRGVAAQ